MNRNPATTERLRNFIAKIESATESGELHWERQAGSAHRYARLNNNLLILGPASPLGDTSIPRYLFITPFDSPDCVEINSDDADLGPAVMKLVKLVEDRSKAQPPNEPVWGTQKLMETLRNE